MCRVKGGNKGECQGWEKGEDGQGEGVVVDKREGSRVGRRGSVRVEKGDEVQWWE
jgi:hypothetical protein